MSHTCNIECESCGDKFCFCHDAVYGETKDGQKVIFCCDNCKDDYIETWTDCEPKHVKYQLVEDK